MKMEEAATRSYVFGVLGWLLALCLLVLGYIQNRTASHQIMRLLQDNIATRIEVLESRDILPRAEREIAILQAKIAALETELGSQSVNSDRLQQLENEVLRILNKETK